MTVAKGSVRSCTVNRLGFAGDRLVWIMRPWRALTTSILAPSNGIALSAKTGRAVIDEV